jgi:integrase
MDAPLAPALRSALEGYLAHLTVERGLSVNTLAAYRRDLTRYVEHLETVGRADVADVTEADVEAFLVAVRTGSDGRAVLSASSAKRAVVAVRGWHRFGVLEGLSAADPARAVRPPQQSQTLPKAISTHDVERLLDAASLGDGPVPLRDRALLELVYSTGARISEAVGLDVDDLDLTEGRAAVRLFGKGPARAGGGGPRRIGRVPQHPRCAAVPAERVGGAADRRRARRPARRGPRVAAHAPPLVRHAPAGRRRRRPGGAGAARARVGDHHADLHQGDAGHAARGLRDQPPARQAGQRRACRRPDGTHRRGRPLTGRSLR